jgi:hypothetical protein
MFCARLVLPCGVKIALALVERAFLAFRSVPRSCEFWTVARIEASIIHDIISSTTRTSRSGRDQRISSAVAVRDAQCRHLQRQEIEAIPSEYHRPLVCRTALKCRDCGPVSSLERVRMRPPSARTPAGVAPRMSSSLPSRSRSRAVRSSAACVGIGDGARSCTSRFQTRAGFHDGAATNHHSDYMAACCILLAELFGPAHACSEQLCMRHREGSMRAQNRISRRHILALSAAAGSLAIGGDLREASGQAGKRIERLDPSLDTVRPGRRPVVRAPPFRPAPTYAVWPVIYAAVCPGVRPPRQIKPSALHSEKRHTDPAGRNAGARPLTRRTKVCHVTRG